MRCSQFVSGKMNYLRRLLGVEFAAQVALASCAMPLSILFVAASFFLRDGSESATRDLLTAIALWDALKVVSSIALTAYFYSVVAVALVIAPGYALIEAMGRANPMTAAMTGLLPGLAFLLFRVTPFAVFDGGGPFRELACMAMGASVGIAIHLVRTWNGARRKPSSGSLERSPEQ